MPGHQHPTRWLQAASASGSGCGWRCSASEWDAVQGCIWMLVRVQGRRLLAGLAHGPLNRKPFVPLVAAPRGMLTPTPAVCLT